MPLVIRLRRFDFHVDVPVEFEPAGGKKKPEPDEQDRENARDET